MHGTISSGDTKEHAWSIPLADIHVGDPALYATDSHWPYFDRLRKEDPVHYCRESEFGPYWSVTKYNDIMDVETSHQVYSSDSSLGGITIRDSRADLRRPSFISMDQPKHGPQRKTVAPMFTPTHLDKLALTIRERACLILDELPRNETFDWVDRVSVELTTQMLATLFDFPWEDRRKLTYWSDIATAVPGAGMIETLDEKQVILEECGDYFKKLWNEPSTSRRSTISCP